MSPPKRAKPKATCKLSCCTVTDEVKERIRESVEAGRGKSMFDGANSKTHAAMCRCGVPRKPPGISKHINDDGLCPVHPEAPPQRWTRGAESYGDN